MENVGLLKPYYIIKATEFITTEFKMQKLYFPQQTNIGKEQKCYNSVNVITDTKTVLKAKNDSKPFISGLHLKLQFRTKFDKYSCNTLTTDY